MAQENGHWGDQGDGTYRNPVIAADYSDPDPLRVGDDYYLVSSTFESFPGVSILHSKDLVNWTTIGAALTDLAAVNPAYTVKKMERYNGGVYAPTISYHNGKYYIYVNLYTDGFYMATADHPKGPWKSGFVKDKYGRPLRVTRWSDPCPFWDDDGKAYLVASHPVGSIGTVIFFKCPRMVQLCWMQIRLIWTKRISYIGIRMEEL